MKFNLIILSSLLFFGFTACSKPKVNQDISIIEKECKLFVSAKLGIPIESIQTNKEIVLGTTVTIPVKIIDDFSFKNKEGNCIALDGIVFEYNKK